MNTFIQYSQESSDKASDLLLIGGLLLMILFILLFMWPILVYEKVTRNKMAARRRGDQSLVWLGVRVLGSTVFTTALYVSSICWLAF